MRVVMTPYCFLQETHGGGTNNYIRGPAEVEIWLGRFNYSWSDDSVWENSLQAWNWKDFYCSFGLISGAWWVCNFKAKGNIRSALSNPEMVYKRVLTVNISGKNSGMGRGFLNSQSARWRMAGRAVVWWLVFGFPVSEHTSFSNNWSSILTVLWQS